MAGPCIWPVSYEECGACNPQEFFTEDNQATFEEMAVDYLWNWTGRKLGLCPVTVRPCRADCPGSNHDSSFWGRGPYYGRAPYGPVLIGGSWFNLSCQTCGPTCGCLGDTPALWLPGPVEAVTQVMVDGAVLPAASYRVDNRQWLVRTDGARWPVCQDMSLPLTEPKTWAVDYTRGTPVPRGGQVAAGVLALELAKAACNDQSCQLPKRWRTITREGVTVVSLDTFEDIDKGHTGVWVIDSWVASVTKPPFHPSTVRSVDVGPKGRVTTWPVT